MEETTMIKLRAKTSTTEIVGTTVAILLCMYMLLGMPVWVALADGKPVYYPGLLYEPAVALVQMLR
jgi:hypothetical protein